MSVERRDSPALCPFIAILAHSLGILELLGNLHLIIHYDCSRQQPQHDTAQRAHGRKARHINRNLSGYGQQGPPETDYNSSNFGSAFLQPPSLLPQAIFRRGYGDTHRIPFQLVNSNNTRPFLSCRPSPTPVTQPRWMHSLYGRPVLEEENDF